MVFLLGFSILFSFHFLLLCDVLPGQAVSVYNIQELQLMKKAVLIVGVSNLNSLMVYDDSRRSFLFTFLFIFYRE